MLEVVLVLELVMYLCPLFDVSTGKVMEAPLRKIAAVCLYILAVKPKHYLTFIFHGMLDLDNY